MGTGPLVRWLAGLARRTRAAFVPSVLSLPAQPDPGALTLGSIAPHAYAIHVDLEKRVFVVYDLTR